MPKCAAVTKKSKPCPYKAKIGISTCLVHHPGGIHHWTKMGFKKKKKVKVTKVKKKKVKVKKKKVVKVKVVKKKKVKVTKVKKKKAVSFKAKAAVFKKPKKPKKPKKAVSFKAKAAVFKKPKGKGAAFALDSYADSGQTLNQVAYQDFQFIDTNKDNVISASEYKAKLPRYFNKMSKDYVESMGNQFKFSKYDSNQDSKLDPSEARRFSRDIRKEIYNVEKYQKHSASKNIMQSEYPCYGKPGTAKGMSIPSDDHVSVYLLMRYLVELQGVRTYINFTVKDKTEEKLFKDVCRDKKHCSFHYITVVDYMPPTKATLNKFLDIFDKAKGRVNIAMHCTAGWGRTGTMAWAYMWWKKAQAGADITKHAKELAKILSNPSSLSEAAMKRKIKKTYLYKLVDQGYSHEAAHEVFLEALEDDGGILLLRARLRVIKNTINQRLGG